MKKLQPAMLTLLLLPCALSLAPAASALQIKPLTLPAARQSAQPSVVADPKRQEFVLSWQQKHSDQCHSLELAVATSKAAGVELGKTHTAARGCDWFVNWADFPSVAVADNGDWVTHFLQRHPQGKYAYNIMVTRSSNRGAQWEPPFRLHDDNSPTEHGFVALAPAGGDRVLAAWLDGRKMHAPASPDKTSGHDAHAHHNDQMSLRSALIQRGGNILSAQEIDAKVCSCCNNDLTRAGSTHQLVFRNRSDEEIRDIGTAFWRDGLWHAHGIVHSDQWKIAGCPVNGPAIAAPLAPPKKRAQAENIVVWTTMVGEALAVRAKLRGEKTASAMITLDAGETVLGRVDVAPWRDSQWLVSWLGSAPKGQSALFIAVLDAKLQVLEKRRVTTLAAGRNIGMPRLASLGKRAVLLWTDATQKGDAVQTQVRAVQID